MPQEGLYKFEVQGGVQRKDIKITLHRIPSRTSKAELLMDLYDIPSCSRTSSARHIYASTTAMLMKNDRVFLVQESNGGFYFNGTRAIRLSFTGALIRMEYV